VTTAVAPTAESTRGQLVTRAADRDRHGSRTRHRDARHTEVSSSTPGTRRAGEHEHEHEPEPEPEPELAVS